MWKSVVLALVLASCAIPEPGEIAEDSDTESSQHALEIPITPTGGGQIIPSHNKKIQLLHGYDLLYDADRPTLCIDRPEDDSEASRNVRTHSFSGGVELIYVASRGQLLDELGFKGALDVRNKLFNVEGGAELVRAYSQDRFAVNMLIRITAKYTTTYHQRDLYLRVDEVEENGNSNKKIDATAWLEEGAATFHRHCGAAFAQGLEYGAGYFMLQTYVAQDEATAREVRANFGVEAGTPKTVKVKADTKLEVESAAVLKNVSSSRRRAYYGFFPTDADHRDNEDAIRKAPSVAPNGLRRPAREAAAPEAAAAPGPEGAPSPASGPGEGDVVAPESPLDDEAEVMELQARDELGVSDDLLALVAHHHETMKASIQLDKCHDSVVIAPDDSEPVRCSDGRAPAGYFQNTNKQATVVGVLPGLYSSAVNVDIDDENDPFREINERQLAVADFIRAFTYMQRALEDIYRRELKPFIDADETVQAMYNIVVGDPKRTRKEVEQVVNAWASRLRPVDDEHGPGSDVHEVANLIRNCWDKAASNITHRCWPEDVDPTDSAQMRNNDQWRRFDDILVDYAQNGRVARLRFKVGNAVKGEWAGLECLNPGGPLSEDGKPLGEQKEEEEGEDAPEVSLAAGERLELENENNYELPTASVIPRIQPALTGLVPNHETWFMVRKHDREEHTKAADEFARAKGKLYDPEQTPHPMVASYPDEKTLRWWAATADRRLHTVCVSVGGVIPKLTDPSLWVPSF